MTARTISVVTPARDAAATIGETLSSLAPAADLIGEIVLIDDGSSDGTADVASREAARRGLPLTVLSGPARGASAARNLGLAHASCPLVYLVDADDLVRADGLRALAAVLDADPACGLVVGTVIDRIGEQRRRHRQTAFEPAPLRNAEAYIGGLRPLIRTGSALGRRELLASVPFPEGLPYQEETIFWTAVLARAPAVAIGDDVLEYRIGTDRSHRRLVDGHREKFLRLARAIRGTGLHGITARAQRIGRGRNALTLGRRLVVEGKPEVAARYLRYAWKADSGAAYRWGVAKAWLRLALHELRHRRSR